MFRKLRLRTQKVVHGLAPFRLNLDFIIEVELLSLFNLLHFCHFFFLGGLHRLCAPSLKEQVLLTLLGSLDGNLLFFRLFDVFKSQLLLKWTLFEKLFLFSIFTRLVLGQILLYSLQLLPLYLFFLTAHFLALSDLALKVLSLKILQEKRLFMLVFVPLVASIVLSVYLFDQFLASLNVSMWVNPPDRWRIERVEIGLFHVWGYVLAVVVGFLVSFIYDASKSIIGNTFDLLESVFYLGQIAQNCRTLFRTVLENGLFQRPIFINTFVNLLFGVPHLRIRSMINSVF